MSRCPFLRLVVNLSQRLKNDQKIEQTSARQRALLHILTSGNFYRNHQNSISHESKSVVTAQDLQSFKTILTVELSQT